MRSRGKLFLTVALIEVPTGLALLIFPALLFWILFGIQDASPEVFVVSRIAGVAIFSVGVASLLARNEGDNSSHHGLLWQVFVFNAGAGFVISWTGLMTQFVGIALWPVAAIHILIAIWCASKLASLR